MKAQAIVALVALVFAVSSASAEPKAQKGKGAAAPLTVYFDLSSSVFSELGSEALLKETRQGTTVVAAELEVCHLVESGSSQLDRFVVPLKVEGTRLVGTAQSQEKKQAVSVNLVRRTLANGNITFEGTIRSGSHTEKVRSSDNTALSEDEATEQYLGDTEIVEAPEDFTAVWPQALAVRVRRAELPAFLEALRDQNVRIVFNGLATSCKVLRWGHYTVQVDLDPERAGMVLAKLKSLPAVVAAGFASNSPNMQRAIRFPSAGWRDAGGRLDRDKFAAAVGKAMAEAMSATLGTTTWNDRVGNLTIEMKRPDDTVAGLKLSQLVTVTAIVAPESPTSSQRSILWIEAITSRIVEDRDGARLEFFMAQPDENDEDQSSEPDGADDLPEAVATALKGQAWDSENERWEQ
jgi:hypothetical protein